MVSGLPYEALTDSNWGEEGRTPNDVVSDHWLGRLNPGIFLWSRFAHQSNTGKILEIGAHRKDSDELHVTTIASLNFSRLDNVNH